MNNEFQPCEVIESNLLDPTKPTDYAEITGKVIKTPYITAILNYKP